MYTEEDLRNAVQAERDACEAAVMDIQKNWQAEHGNPANNAFDGGVAWSLKFAASTINMRRYLVKHAHN
jgi:hypothetical protein